MLISDLDHLHEGFETAHTQPFQRSDATLLALLVAFTLVYVPVLITPYATADDYVTASIISQGGMSEWKLRLAGGRPLDAVLNHASFFLATSIDHLGFLRALSVLGIVLLAWRFNRTLVDAGWAGHESLLLCVIVFTMPAFQVYASWAVAAFYPFAALAAGVALLKSDQLVSAGFAESRWRTPTRVIGAIALLLAATIVYQPAAMVFWAFAAVTLFKPGAKFRSILLRFVWHTGICASALACGYAVYSLGQSFFGAELLNPLRSQLVTDIRSKFLWFVSEPLVNSLNLVMLSPRIWVAVAVALVLIVGLLLYFEGNDFERLGQLAIAMLILPLSYLPNLIVAENWSSYRTLSGLGSVVVVYLFFALAGYIKLRRRFGAVPPAAGLLTAPALLACVIAGYNVQTYFASPLYRERMWIHDQLQKADLGRARGIYVLPSEWHHSIAPDVRYDEFGTPFSSRAYALKPAVNLAFSEIKGGNSGIPIEIASSDDPRQAPAEFVVLDMRKIWSLRFD